MLANMGKEYKVILRQRTTFTGSKLKRLKGWEAMSENSDLIALMKGIKGLIFKQNDMEYLFTGMQLALCGFLNLYQRGVTITEYHKRWTAGKELAEEFGYKIRESRRATDQECGAKGNKASDNNYNEKCAGEGYLAW